MSTARIPGIEQGVAMKSRLVIGMSACVGLGLLVTGCGGPPTAKEILAKPANSDLKDSHVSVTGHIVSGAFSLDVTGDGVIILRPKAASHLRLQGSLGAIPIAIEELSSGGKSYSRVGSAKWTVDQASGGTAGTSWSDARNPSVVGEENLPAGKVWHVKATGSDGKPFDIWVRESDGYPLKLSGLLGDGGTINLVFDKFNTGAVVAVPAASDIKPPAINVAGKLGVPVPLSAATVTVMSTDSNYKSSNEFLQPSPGNRFVAVEVLYENTGTDKLTVSPSDWKLTDSSGFNYQQNYSGKSPELNSGDLVPGDKARGFITYEVPQSAGGLTLKLSLGDDTLTFSLG